MHGEMPAQQELSPLRHLDRQELAGTRPSAISGATSVIEWYAPRRRVDRISAGRVSSGLARAEAVASANETAPATHPSSPFR
jgi:hypothetical protein